MSGTLSIKATFNDDTRRFALAHLSHAALLDRLLALFPVRRPRITWRDADGDVVTIATDDDLREAAAAAAAAAATGAGVPTLRLAVHESDTTTSTSTPTTTTTTAPAFTAAAASPAPVLEDRVARMDLDDGPAKQPPTDHIDTPTPTTTTSTPTPTPTTTTSTSTPAPPPPPPASSEDAEMRDIPEQPYVPPFVAMMRSVLGHLAAHGIDVEVVRDDSGDDIPVERATGCCGDARACERECKDASSTPTAATPTTGAAGDGSGRADVDGDKVVHAGVVCDACGSGIVGRRYKCCVCADFDLCMRCEARGEHADHAMVRLCRPRAGHPYARRWAAAGPHPHHQQQHWFGGHHAGRYPGCGRRAWAAAQDGSDDGAARTGGPCGRGSGSGCCGGAAAGQAGQGTAGQDAARADAARPATAAASELPEVSLLRDMGFDLDDAAVRALLRQYGGQLASVIAHLVAE